MSHPYAPRCCEITTQLWHVTRITKITEQVKRNALSYLMFIVILITISQQGRLDMRKQLFFRRRINYRNQLSNGCTNASSVRMFKNKIDSYLARADYKQMDNCRTLDKLKASLPSEVC